jgi:putative membrane protein
VAGETVRRVAGAAAGSTALAMIAFPLAERRSERRRWISSAVVGGLATTTTALAARRWGWPRAAVAASVLAAGTLAVERAGTSAGVPFGRYEYTHRLRPVIAGVPAIVPLAWWAMAVPAREAAHAALGVGSSVARRVGLGAAALAAWDLFLDPQMTGEGFWRWPGGGRYRGIPLSNFAGWLATGAAVMAVLEAALPPRRADAGLVAAYAGMAVMETIGFAVFFADRLVAAVGGAAMLPIAAAGVAGIARG